jgi:hypothetical protein
MPLDSCWNALQQQEKWSQVNLNEELSTNLWTRTKKISFFSSWWPSQPWSWWPTQASTWCVNWDWSQMGEVRGQELQENWWVKLSLGV